MTSGYSISLTRDPARGTSQLYLSVAWTSAFKQFFQSTPLLLPCIQSWGVCCFLQVARTAAQHCMQRKWLNVRKALYGIMPVLILSAIEHFCLRTSDKRCLEEGGDDVLMQANKQTEIGLRNKNLRWLLVSNPRVGTNHEELTWTWFFFCNFLFVNVENPQISPQQIVLKRRLAHGWPRGWRWFFDKEKLQAPLPEFSITIALKPKKKEKRKV